MKSCTNSANSADSAAASTGVAKPPRMATTRKTGSISSHLASHKARPAHAASKAWRPAPLLAPTRTPQAAISPIIRRPGRMPPMKSRSIGCLATMP